jgi:hypothetical protein
VQRHTNPSSSFGGQKPFVLAKVKGHFLFEGFAALFRAYGVMKNNNGPVNDVFFWVI